VWGDGGALTVRWGEDERCHVNLTGRGMVGPGGVRAQVGKANAPPSPHPHPTPLDSGNGRRAFPFKLFFFPPTTITYCHHDILILRLPACSCENAEMHFRVNELIREPFTTTQSLVQLSASAHASRRSATKAVKATPSPLKDGANAEGWRGGAWCG
jgi:hypothetical protein